VTVSPSSLISMLISQLMLLITLVDMPMVIVD
jgi:hypothetical protein